MTPAAAVNARGYKPMESEGVRPAANAFIISTTGVWRVCLAPTALAQCEAWGIAPGNECALSKR